MRTNPAHRDVDVEGGTLAARRSNTRLRCLVFYGDQNQTPWKRKLSHPEVEATGSFVGSPLTSLNLSLSLFISHGRHTEEEEEEEEIGNSRLDPF